jgi:hypothetical protein
MSMSYSRTERLNNLSQMVINGAIVHKLDHIASIAINGRHYFNVYRRYNSNYNIVVEDNNYDIYLHQDHTVRKSLQTVLCLPEFEAANIYTWNATSYKHNGPVPSIDHDIADMRWTEIQARYQAISVNFGGIFYNDYVPSTPLMYTIPEDVKDECPSTPRDQIRQTPENPPNAPSRPESISDGDAANILMSLSMPVLSNPWVLRECDGPTLSMRFADIQNRKRKREWEHVSCYCQMDSDDSDDDSDSDDNDDDEFDENNYTILRNGTVIRKPFTQ